MSAPRTSWPADADDGHPVNVRPERGAGPAVSVLADRLAAALVHHEPGWRLPRHSALARRYNVSAAEIDAAVTELVSRHLLRRQTDGQLYRASPAEYLISLEGVAGLVSQVDAMGGELACRSRQAAWRVPPEDISRALQVPSDQPVCVVRVLWTAGGEPAALCTSFIPGGRANECDCDEVGQTALPAELNLLQASVGGPVAAPGSAADPAALHIELQAPPPSVARSLRLTAGQPAVMVTVRFDNRPDGQPTALTIAVLRSDMFRVVVRTPQPPLPDGDGRGLSGSWTHALEDPE